MKDETHQDRYAGMGSMQNPGEPVPDGKAVDGGGDLGRQGQSQATGGQAGDACADGGGEQTSQSSAMPRGGTQAYAAQYAQPWAQPMPPFYGQPWGYAPPQAYAQGWVQGLQHPFVQAMPYGFPPQQVPVTPPVHFHPEPGGAFAVNAEQAKPKPEAEEAAAEGKQGVQKGKGSMKGKDEEHVCNCGSSENETPAPQAPYSQMPFGGGHLGMFAPLMNMFCPQPGVYGAAPANSGAYAPQFFPQAGPYPGSYGAQPAFQGQPAQPPFEARQAAPDSSGDSCADKDPHGPQHGAMPNFNAGGFGPQFGTMDPKHLEQRFGQLQELCTELMQGKVDPLKIASLVNSGGTHFWKGAIVGAALIFLLSNESVKSALGDSLSAILGSAKSAATE